MTTTRGYVRTANHSDVKFIADDMRKADVAEVGAYSGKTPEQSLTNSLNFAGAITKTICLTNGIPVGMYGVVPSGAPKVGIIWMLAANNIRVIHKQFLRESRSRIDELCQGYDLIFNFTDARNSVHHRWIKWAGFTIIKRHEQFGVGHMPFFEFTRIVEKQKHV